MERPAAREQMTACPVGRRAAVVVVGDLGRSPRTLYHALALAENGAAVDLIGCLQTPLPPAAQQAERLAVRRLPPLHTGPGRGRALRLLAALVRLPFVAIALMWKLLAVVPRPDLILVQNPPGLPALPIAWLAARVRGATLVVDWHNFGWTLLALRLGSRHPLVRALRAVEIGFGRRADRAFCVSEAMRRELEKRWGVAGVRVFYDRPARFFRPELRDESPPKEILARTAAAPRAPAGKAGSGIDGLRAAVARAEAVVVSSTSWGADEDFGMLLEAAVRYDELIENQPGVDLPRLRVLISGKGPGRQACENRIRELVLRHVQIETLWLPAAAYPRFLAHGDVGVCVHRSSSGLDLPMKLADMRGSGLPVCAFDYGPCLAEVLEPGADGFVFRDARELAERLAELLEGFPAPTAAVNRARRRVLRSRGPSWSEEWRTTCLPRLIATRGA